MVTVIYGYEFAEADLKGFTVSNVRLLYSGLLNLAPSASARVNSKKVNDDYRLENGDELVFERARIACFS